MVGADASGLAATEQTRALAAEAWLLPLASGTKTGALLLNGVSETPRFGDKRISPEFEADAEFPNLLDGEVPLPAEEHAHRTL